jgi:hypothetical protein
MSFTHGEWSMLYFVIFAMESSTAIAATALSTAAAHTTTHATRTIVAHTWVVLLSPQGRNSLQWFDSSND